MHLNQIRQKSETIINIQINVTVNDKRDHNAFKIMQLNRA